MRVSTHGYRANWGLSWSAKLASSTTLGHDLEAARASRERQAELAGVELSDGIKKLAEGRAGAEPKGRRRGAGVVVNGHHKQVTEQILRDRVLAEQEKARALAPVRLSFEEPG